MRLGRSGVAGLELALVAPMLVSLMIAAVDFGAALLSKAQISQALAGAAEYATLAAQNKVAQATIVTNTQTFAGSLSSAFVGSPTVSAVVNNGAASGSTCCIGAAWSCSTSSTFKCADGSTPGTYITVSASYPFKALFSADTILVGKTLSDSIVAPLQ